MNANLKTNMPMKVVKNLALCALVGSSLAGCVRPRPSTTDFEGPNFKVLLSGAIRAELPARNDDPATSVNRCAIIPDAANVGEQNIDVTVLVSDLSGMRYFEISAQNIQPNSVVVGPEARDVRSSFNDTNLVDTVRVDFTSPGIGEIRTGGTLQFRIADTFHNGVTLTGQARDTFGNVSTFEPFQLLSRLADNPADPCLIR
ncbi:hypothetical protein [Hydrogenophaga sp. 5NK40-0174]|uniref:hypothetical protein n=1 Tax=Hydrogenophaga sp. 5NK40-0174 TaxID=3127649 RepID=UPI00334140FC